MSQSNSKPQLALPYLAKTDGRSSKFPKGTKVIVLWRGTTDYGECVQVISEEEFVECLKDPHRPLPRSVFPYKNMPDRVKDVLVMNRDNTEIRADGNYKFNVSHCDGFLKQGADNNNPVLFYGKIKMKQTRHCSST